VRMSAQRSAETTRLSTGRPYRRRALMLVVVAACYGVVQYLVNRRTALGWDETVYVSQVARGVPPSVFSAPRARGVVLVVAPVAMLTDSVAAIRAYLSVVSAIGLAAAYWPWLRLRSGVVVPLAAALFAAQWLSVFYGSEAMPNPYVAFGAVAATGWFLRLVAEPARWAPRAGLAVAVAVTALVRPFDAFWIALPLLVAGAVRRRRPPVVATVIGLAAGGADWVVEAFVSYGGPIARLHAAGAENETGLHVSLGDHLRALNGPLLCRPPVDCGGYPWGDVVWFAAIPVLAIAGLLVLRLERSPHLRAAALAAVVAVTFAAAYFVLVGYAAPRFLMPVYALAMIPVAEGITGLCRHGPLGLRVPVALVASAGVAAYVFAQVQTLTTLVPSTNSARTADVQVAGELTRIGVTAPCLLYGHDAVQIAYHVRCASWGIRAGWGGAEVPEQIRTALGDGRRVVVIARTKKPPAPFLRTWRRQRLPAVTAVPGRWYAYLPPAGSTPAHTP
jgi:hypothetical protein